MADTISASTSSTARVEGPLGPVSTFSGQLEYAGDHDWIGVQLLAGHTYEFNLDLLALGSNNVDAFLALYDSSGTAMAYDDDNGAGNSSLIKFTANSSGLYFLGAQYYTDLHPANYSLAATDTTGNGFTDVFDPGASYSATALQRVYAGFGDQTINADPGGSQIFGGQGNDVLNGNASADALSGGIGNDSIYGGAGNDIIFGDSGNDQLFAQSDNDSMYGGLGDDTLDGGADKSMMVGGDGDDTYNVTSVSGAVIIEASSAAGGYDLVVTTQNFTVPMNVEAMVYTGPANAKLLGNSQANAISGGVTKDTIAGYGGNDSIGGGAGDDSLDGGQGNDVMNGSTGNDVMFVDSAGDQVFEATAGGTDTVLSSVTYVLTAGQAIEVLATTSQGGTGAINLTGNLSAQMIRGNAGANILNDGGEGLYDTMIGFGGADTYIVHNSGDQIVESTAAVGSDTVFVDVSYELANNQSVETLATTSQGGMTPLSISGNNLAQTIRGNEGINGLYGGDGNDTLFGFGGNDKLVGGNGHDVMDGGAGNDLFAYAAVAESTGVNRDLIQNMNIAGADQFRFTVKPTNGIHLAVTHGSLSEGSFDTDLTAAIHDATELGVNQAVLFTPDGGGLIHHVFLIVDANSKAGYQAGVDYVVELQNLTGTLTTDDFM